MVTTADCIVTLTISREEARILAAAVRRQIETLREVPPNADEVRALRECLSVLERAIFSAD